MPTRYIVKGLDPKVFRGHCALYGTLTGKICDPSQCGKDQIQLLIIDATNQQLKRNDLTWDDRKLLVLQKEIAVRVLKSIRGII